MLNYDTAKYLKYKGITPQKLEEDPNSHIRSDPLDFCMRSQQSMKMLEIFPLEHVGVISRPSHSNYGKKNFIILLQIP